ncbi:hypothetical protein ACSVIJ_04830 [Pseudomonas sp. NCHU5208]|uniref:hypothetical protein n=1 Tax=unclassified Pseudomonas TaxID=196821 RepID=UPI003F9AA231
MTYDKFAHVAVDLLAHLERLPDGVYFFNFVPSTGALSHPDASTVMPPVQVEIATAKSLSKCLSAFEHWEGSVRIGTLRGSEGLPIDFWIA